VLRSRLFSLRLDKVSLSDIDKWMGECSEAGLVRCYEVESKPYVEILDFNQTIRIKKRKFPYLPESAIHMQADDKHMRLGTNPIQTGDGAGKPDYQNPTSPSLQSLKPIEELKTSFEASQHWLEVAAMKMSTTIDKIKSRLTEFNIHLVSITQTHKTEKDYATHFFSWLPKQKDDAKPGTIKRQKTW
jgi:hypothetical protein